MPETETTLGHAWKRFSLISSIVGEVNGKIIVTVLYFTLALPFGLGSRLLADPLRRKKTIQAWEKRDAIPTDLDSAKLQG